MKWRNMLGVNGGKLLTLICAAVVAGCAFADRTANREWVGRNFAPSNLVPRVEALENKTDSETLALGEDSFAECPDAVAIGAGASASGLGTVQLGRGENTNPETLRFHSWTVIDSDGKVPQERLPEVLPETDPKFNEWRYTATGVSIGGTAVIENTGVAIGGSTYAKDDGVAIGYCAIASGAGSSQIGPGINEAAGTLQYKGWRLVESDGTIPAARLPSKWATGNLTNANGVGLVDLKDKTKFLPGGETWVKSSITSGRFNCVAFGNGVFVAGGYDSKGIYYSSDGKTWTQGSITSKTITELCFGGGRFVAAIQNEGLWYSDDNGVNWTQSNITYGNGWPLAYDSGVFVAANSNGSGIFSSTNGTTWAATSVTGGYWFMAAAGNGVYLAAGTQAGQGVQYSTDGQNWTRVAALGTSWGSVCLGYGGGRFVIEQQGGRGAYCSSDGLTWTQTTGYASGSYEQRVLAWGNGRFLNGANYGLDDGELAWKKVGNGRGWRSLAYGNGRFVGATYSSSEGLWYADDPIGHVVPVVQRIRVNGIELTADGDNVVDIPIATLKSALGIE